jgi:rhodanese-related sulfurtransferase
VVYYNRFGNKKPKEMKEMKRFLAVFALFLFALTLSACGEETTQDDDNESVEIPETLEMADVDEYLFNPDYQFVDVRDFDDQMADGWIRGFEFIPFFQYLEYTDILVRTDGWDYDGSQILDEGALRALFDEDKVIVLMCAGGTRAGFVRDALIDLGYENVFNVGGLSSYEGENRVFGDGNFTIEMPHPSTIADLPEDIDMSDELIDYYAMRDDVMFVDLRNFSDTVSLGWHSDSTVIPFFEYLEAENILVRSETDPWVFNPEDIQNEDVLRNIFDEEMNIILFCAGGTRAQYVMDALEHLGYENVWNAGAYGDYTGTNVIDPEGVCDEEDNTGDGGCE